MRTLILDQAGNAVITSSEKYDKITIMVGEYWVQGNLIPSKQFSIESLDSIRSVRDYLNSVISRGDKVAQLVSEHKELSQKYLETKDEEIHKRITEIKAEFTKLKGNSANNGRNIYL